jgi:hypothetical protein
MGHVDLSTAGPDDYVLADESRLDGRCVWPQSRDHFGLNEPGSY